jgi:copper(I)-binding protein
VSSSLRRGALAAVAIAFSIASLAACGAGNDAQTLEVKPDNAAVSVGDIKVQNALVITQPLTGASPQPTGPAVISATLFNTGSTPQTLDSVSVDGVGTAKLTPAKGKGKLVVPAGGSLVLGGKGNASAALTDAGTGLEDGNAQKITFTLSTTGGVSLSAFVVPADSYFTKWGPTSIPTPTQGTTATATTSGSPKPGKSTSATPTDSASASATATESATTTG